MQIQFGARWLETGPFIYPQSATIQDAEEKVRQFMTDPAVQKIFQHTSDDIVLRFQEKDNRTNQVVLQIARPLENIPEKYQKYAEPKEIVWMTFDALHGEKRHYDAAKHWINQWIVEISNALEEFDRNNAQSVLKFLRDKPATDV